VDYKKPQTDAGSAWLWGKRLPVQSGVVTLPGEVPRQYACLLSYTRKK